MLTSVVVCPLSQACDEREEGGCRALVLAHNLSQQLKGVALKRWINRACKLITTSCEFFDE